jgi:signal transduction histidine kinase
LPIRLRLTAAFAAAVVLVLTTSGLFVYVRLRMDLNDSIDEELRARASAVAELVRRSGPEVASSTPLEDVEESFVQILDLDGRLLDGAGTARLPALSPAELDKALLGDAWVERVLPGVDGKARMLARPVMAGERVVVVVGQSLGNRDEALADVRNSFAIGGPVAVVAASLVGYWLARLGFRPVEEMRRTAGDISSRRTGRRLPLPEANDEIRRLGETLNDMLDRLEHSLERERRFVSDASHELRTPIAVAKTELEGALRTGDFGPDVGEAIKAALEECDSLGQLADDLLVVARTNEGGLELLLEPLPVHDVLDAVRDRFIDRAASHGRDIVVDVEDAHVVLGDRARLRQALGNLVDNALRYGDGTVTLRGYRLADAIALDVSDEGPGFAADVVDRAFDRFARGHGARARAGAGLGLAIVRALAHAHGGQAAIIDHHPAGRAGATVRVTLPTAPHRRPL